MTEEKYKRINDAVNKGRVEELKAPDVTKWVNMRMEKAKINFDNANWTRKVQLRASLVKHNSNTTATTKFTTIMYPH